MQKKGNQPSTFISTSKNIEIYISWENKIKVWLTFVTKWLEKFSLEKIQKLNTKDLTYNMVKLKSPIIKKHNMFILWYYLPGSNDKLNPSLKMTAKTNRRNKFFMVIYHTPQQR